MAVDNTFPSSVTKFRSISPRFYNSASKRVFSDVAGDIMICVDGKSFLLHKFPLVSRSGKICKMLVDSRDPNLSKLEFFNMPGGFFAFELAVKFCYGINFEITTSNVAHLRCIAEYLEMTEDYREHNLISRAENYMSEVVFQSIQKSIQVLCSCSSLLPNAEEIGIISKCIDSVAAIASKEQLVSGLAKLDYDGKFEKLEVDCQDWWVEDLSTLSIDFYHRVISAMRNTGVRSESIAESLVHYAHTSLKGVEKRRVRDSNLSLGDEERVIVETLLCLLSTDKIVTIPLAFLFGMLRMAIEVNASVSCRLDLEMMIGCRLELASLDDLLIPSLQTNDSVFDIDTVHRILANFMKRIEEEDSEESFQCGYESETLNSSNHTFLLKVGRLIDGYLAEIAPDPCLELQKFMALIELLPDYARVIEDGLYRAVDIYLKAHPSLTESESQKLCKLIDCQKLSQEACNHAAQNDRLPVQMTVRVLYFDQVRLKSAMSTSSADGSFSQRVISSSGVPSAAVSPRDNYASLRRENRELKLEISRMRVRLSELEKEHALMKDGMRDGRSGEHGRAFFSSLSKGIGKMGFFGPGSGKQQKNVMQSQATDEKSRRRRHRRSSIT